MGYTHNFTLERPIESKVVQEIKEILMKYNDIIQYESDINKPARIDTEIIRFNGVGDDGYETFLVEGESGNFCKTNMRPYDIVVCEVLLVLKGYYRDDFDLSSDGFWVSEDEFKNNQFYGNWNEALENVTKFGYDFKITHKIDKGVNRDYYKLGIE